MRRYKRVVVAMLAASIALVGPAVAKDRDNGHGGRLRSYRVNGSADVDVRNATMVTPKCLPSGGCLVIGFNTTHLTGDIDGDTTYAFTVLQSAQGGGGFNVGQFEVTGTVKGCGTGSFVVAYRPTYTDRTLRPTFDANGNTVFVPGSAEIIRGFRTGDLGDIEGELLLTLVPTSLFTFTVNYSGVVRCTSHRNDGASDVAAD